MKKFDDRIKKILHDNFGINWHKPEDINIISGQGKFTIDNLIKIHQLSENNLNLLLVSYPYYGDKENYTTKIVQINPDLKNIDLLSTYKFWFSYLGKFNTKKDFEACRKDENIFYWVIEIKPEAIINKKNINIEHEIMYNNKNMLERFIVEGEAYIKYTLNYSAIDVSKDGKKYSLNITTMHGRIKINKYDTENGLKHYVLQDVLDKSGYPVYQYRERLKSILRNNKLNNVKNAVKNDTFTERNNHLLKLIMDTKKIYLEKLEQADTSEAILQLESRFCFANRLKKYEQFIEYQKNTLNDELSIYNKFTSIDEVINEYCEIKNKILEDKEALLCL